MIALVIGILAILVGILAFYAFLINLTSVPPIGADLGYRLGFRAAPGLIACTAIALGAIGFGCARSAGRGYVPAIIGLALGLCATALVALNVAFVLIDSA